MSAPDREVRSRHAAIAPDRLGARSVCARQPGGLSAVSAIRFIEHVSPIYRGCSLKRERKMLVKKTTILTADDDPHFLRLIARNLELEGYDVLVASDGKQAIEQIKQYAPDLVLLDVIMPKLDGFMVCRRVREFSAVPIIIVTARGQDQDKVCGLDLGGDDYLT